MSHTSLPTAQKDWLFDGFLFLEFKDGSGRNYTVGYEKLNARKTEWEWLLERIFEQGKSLSALDQLHRTKRSASWASPHSNTRSYWDFPRLSATRRTGASSTDGRWTFRRRRIRSPLQNGISASWSNGSRHPNINTWSSQDSTGWPKIPTTAQNSPFRSANISTPRANSSIGSPTGRQKAMRSGRGWASTWLISSPTIFSTTRSPTAGWTRPALRHANTEWPWSSNSTRRLRQRSPIRRTTGWRPTSTISKRTTSSTPRPSPITAATAAY